MTSTSLPVAESPSGRLLRALVMCDLVDSTALMERLGDQMAAQLTRQHDRMTREVLRQHDGMEVDRTDGFLMLFEAPATSIHFAIDYQRALQALARKTGEGLQARVGIHFGEVVFWENAPPDVERGARASEIDGLALSIVARLVALALPSQILISDVVAALARRTAGDYDPTVQWLSHGNYMLKGVPHPVAVHEVGEALVGPLRAPPASTKAWPSSPWWRRRTALLGGGLALVVGSLPVLYVAVSKGDRRDPLLSNRDWVVVGDFINVNGDPQFDAALSMAFRIGVSESRFVNVVPDVSIRQALARMQRDVSTRIDRRIGVEVALRERARAVILPSMIQSGSRLRLVAEVVDPNSGGTVWTQTVDADESTDLLPAMDRLLQKARGHLGESLQQIQETSQPLERVTTPDLGALRALSSAFAMERDGDLNEAEKLLRHGIELDPDFATAYRTLGSVLVEQERYAEARAVLERALAIEGRLTERERLFTRAFLAEFTDPRSALGQWRAFAVLYPDNGAGQHNAGNLYYAVLHDYASAESSLAQAAVPRNPFLNYTLQLRGHALLAAGKLNEAESQFRAAFKFSPAPILYGLSDVLAANGRLDEAAQYLDNSNRSLPNDDVERAMRRATLSIMQGNVRAATAAVESALAAANRLTSPNARWRAQAALIALRATHNDFGDASELARSLLHELTDGARGENRMVMEQLLYAAGWVARLGFAGEAGKALALAQRHGALDRFPIRARLAVNTQAELELHVGQADAVLARLPPQDGSELWEVHELRARAALAKGDVTAELGELRWLVGHTGRAFGQWTDQFLGQQARALALTNAQVRLGQLGQHADPASTPRVAIRRA